MHWQHFEIRAFFTPTPRYPTWQYKGTATSKVQVLQKSDVAPQRPGTCGQRFLGQRGGGNRIRIRPPAALRGKAPALAATDPPRRREHGGTGSNVAGKAPPGVVVEVTRGSASPRASQEPRTILAPVPPAWRFGPSAAGAAVPFHPTPTARVDKIADLDLASGSVTRSEGPARRAAGRGCMFSFLFFLLPPARHAAGSAKRISIGVDGGAWVLERTSAWLRCVRSRSRLLLSRKICVGSSVWIVRVMWVWIWIWLEISRSISPVAPSHRRVQFHFVFRHLDLFRSNSA